MARRDLLHLDRVGEFGAWLEGIGYVLAEPRRPACEILRAHKCGYTVVVYKRLGAKEHASVRDQDVHIVRKFLQETKSRGMDGGEA